MSIALDIKFSDGTKVHRQLAPQQHAEKVWGGLAHQLGLKYYDNNFPIYIYPDTLADVINELQMLSKANLAAGSGCQDRLEGAIEDLQSLSSRSDWTATIG